MHPYEELGLKHASFDRPFPLRTVATHLYVDYDTYQAIPKPDSYATFFVLRDPRDIVVSWYFSAKYSHPIRFDPIPKWRAGLQNLDEQSGLRYLIDELQSIGSFDAQRSWIDKDIPVFRYEDLATDATRFTRTLFEHLMVSLPEPDFGALLRKHRFASKARGREQGVEDPASHFRKGIAGDWRNRFDAETLEYFTTVTGDLVGVLGYDTSE